MDVVKIDPVRLETFQARLEGRQDVAPGAALQRSGLVHRQSKFGRQHDVFAPVAETFADDFFGLAAIAVDVRGVDMRDAEIERLVYDLARRFDTDAVAAEV